MADKPASDRTEKPTPERLKKARREGQIAQSREIPSALMVVTLLLALGLCGTAVYRWLANQIRQGLAFHAPGTVSHEWASGLLRAKGTEWLVTIAPFLAAAVAASVFGSLLVGGWAFSPKAVQFKLERINPVKGLKNLFSLRSLVTLVVCIAKLVALVTILYFFLRGRMAAVMKLQWSSPEGALIGMSRLVFQLAARVAIALGVIAVMDMLFQKWKHRRDLRMTRQEVKEERRQYEASPEVRSRVRRMQIEMARKRMLEEVPRADVVIANPTHVAVALKYDSEAMVAPEVLAKGGDFLCEKIKEIARANGVPIIHRPELARALYAGADVGQGIPEMLFVAVAEVLAMIYRTKHQLPKGRP